VKLHLILLNVFIEFRTKYFQAGTLAVLHLGRSSQTGFKKAALYLGGEDILY